MTAEDDRAKAYRENQVALWRNRLAMAARLRAPRANFDRLKANWQPLMDATTDRRTPQPLPLTDDERPPKIRGGGYVKDGGY